MGVVDSVNAFSKADGLIGATVGAFAAIRAEGFTEADPAALGKGIQDSHPTGMTTGIA